MSNFVKRIGTLLLGLFLLALGSVIMIMANIGYAPWEVFHVGLALQTSLSIGTATIITGVFITIVDVLCSERIGLGTLANMLLVGLFIDLIMYFDVIPLANSLLTGIVMLIVGFLIVSYGSYLYIKSGFGAGPRDSFTVVLNRKTKLPIGICRSLLELTATFVGWLLGGMVGIGTVISVVASGFFLQMIFSLNKFDAAKIKHESFRQTWQYFTENKS